MSASNALLELAPMTDQQLDVVILGGGGHVGLHLSLALAKAGLWVGIYDSSWRELLPWHPATFFDVIGNRLMKAPRGIVRLSPAEAIRRGA